MSDWNHLLRQSCFSMATRTPSLATSEETPEDSSLPSTPADMSPYINAEIMHPGAQLDFMSQLPRQATGNDLQLTSVDPSMPDVLHEQGTVSLQIKHVCCIGAGYVGGPTAAMIALHNPHVKVTVVDRDEARIAAWKSRHLPIHEPGLIDVVRVARDGATQQTSTVDHSDCDLSDNETVSTKHSHRAPNLFFSTACIESIATADIILISVNTPTKKRGVGAGRATDMTAMEGAVRDVAIHARPGTILVEKSTVPCRTAQMIKDILHSHRPGTIFPILSNPEFLSEGTAIRDLFNPDRVIIGHETTSASGPLAASALASLYSAWVPTDRILPLNIWSSELCKLTANAMLAQRISSINSISAICEKTGADVGEIAKAIGLDARIGPQFLKAGLGFGGSCFRKDIASLTYLAESLSLPEVAQYWNQVLTINNYQRDRFARQVVARLNNSLRGKKLALLGFAFKKDTGDARESPALDVIRILLEEGPKQISIFDPLCAETDIKRELQSLPDDCGDDVVVCADPYDAVRDASAVVVLTEWDMFKPSGVSAPVAVPAKMGRGQTLMSAPTPTAPVKRAEKASKSQYAFLANFTPVPEPSCPSDCSPCTASQERSSKGTVTATQEKLDWRRVAGEVREPRWVFDGRGILQRSGLAEMGFRVEMLGRASAY